MGHELFDRASVAIVRRAVFDARCDLARTLSKSLGHPKMARDILDWLFGARQEETRPIRPYPIMFVRPNQTPGASPSSSVDTSDAPAVENGAIEIDGKMYVDGDDPLPPGTRASRIGRSR